MQMSPRVGFSRSFSNLYRGLQAQWIGLTTPQLCQPLVGVCANVERTYVPHTLPRSQLCRIVPHPPPFGLQLNFRQVKCSICDERPVKRVCHSCRDSYCFECFDALHGKGCRRKHVAPTVHICCSCNYQHVRVYVCAGIWGVLGAQVS